MPPIHIHTFPPFRRAYSFPNTVGLNAHDFPREIKIIAKLHPGMNYELDLPFPSKHKKINIFLNFGLHKYSEYCTLPP